MNVGKEIHEEHFLGGTQGDELRKKEAKLMIGVGFPNTADPRMHPELLNKDLEEKFRTGADHEHFMYPTWDKNVMGNLTENFFNRRSINIDISHRCALECPRLSTSTPR